MMFNELTFGLYCCITAKFGERKNIVLKCFDVDVGHVRYLGCPLLGGFIVYMFFNLKQDPNFFEL